MGDNKGEIAKKQSQQQHLTLPPSPKDNVPVQESSTEEKTTGVGGSVPPFLSVPPPPLYISSGGGEGVNPKRPRFTSTTGQWKLLPSPSQTQQQKQQIQINIMGTESSPSPSAHPQPPHSATTAAASSSDTASSPSHSPHPSASGQDYTNKPDTEQHQQYHQQQLRKGKYVSPVWKPSEMLWLARAWRVQYQGTGRPAGDSGSSAQLTSRMDPQQQDHGGGGGDSISDHQVAAAPQHGRGKTRADKDKEVAEFLNQHGVIRDAKTAGTKWDNMLGEFRKVYEWERGGEREQIGKSYFRLSPYERKVHRLPASFDEEVFEELSQFMGSRMRSTSASSRGASPFLPAPDETRLALTDTKSFPSLPFRDDDFPFSGIRGRQLVVGSGGSGSHEGFMHVGSRGGGGGGLGGFESSPSMDQLVGGHQLYSTPNSSSSTKELRRIGKVRMIWEELVSLWGEEGGDHHQHHRGRIKVQGSSFLGADELTFLDDSMVACTMESFEDGYLKGFSVDRFVSGQQVKVFGRKTSHITSSGFSERLQHAYAEPSTRSLPPCEFEDPTEYYLGCLRVPPPSLPSLIELPWYLQEPPLEELRFPLRKDVYRDMPQGKELFFTKSSERVDCRAITFDLLSPIIRTNPSLTAATATTRESFIGLWDDCINRVVSKFCNLPMVFIRKPSSSSSELVQEDQWPNVTAFVRNFCLWRGEETDQVREASNNNNLDPSSLIVEKLLWTYFDIPYILGYYAVGHIVTFCALSRTHDRITRTDLHTVDLSTPGERIKALVPCWRIAGLLPLLADRCFNQISSFKVFPYSDFERINLGGGNFIESSPNLMTRVFSSKRKWAAVKEIYDFLDHRVPHTEYICRSSEKDLSLTFKPRGSKFKPANCDQLVECLKQVTKALVALHDLSFMHRDLGWEKVMRRSDRDNEWFVIGFDEAMSAPQLYAHGTVAGGGGSGAHAPEMMGRGLHGVKVDVWGVGQLLKNSGLVGVPKLLRELQNRCLDHNPEQRPTAADCYHHLLQLQSSMSATGGY